MNLAYPSPHSVVLKSTLIAVLLGGGACSGKKNSGVEGETRAGMAASEAGSSGQSTPPLGDSSDVTDSIAPMPMDGGTTDQDATMDEADAGTGEPPTTMEEELPSGVIVQEGFESRDAADDWELDLSIGTSNTKRSIRPPELGAGESASFAFNCDLENHGMLTFSYWGDRPTPGQQLRLYVDGALYEVYGNTHWGHGREWFEAAVAVSPGPHAYRFDAVTDVDGRPPFRLDTLRCFDGNVDGGAQSEGPEQFNLDHPYYSPALQGDWLVNNDRFHSAEGDLGLSAQPPLFSEPGSASLEFDCAGAAHSQLTFWYLGQQPTAGQSLRLYVDDELYGDYGNTDWAGKLEWYEAKVVVSNGPHRYRFEASTDVAGRPPFRLDTLHCANVDPETSEDGLFDLDGGYIPPEMSGFWQLNNGQAQTAGGLSAEAPFLAAGGQATLTLDCSAVNHEKLRFWYWGDNPAEDQTLELFIDGVAHSSYGNTNWAGDLAWYETVIEVPVGAHRYEWVATTGTEGRPPFRLDSLHCE